MREILGKFKCPSCNSDTFRVEERRVKYRMETRIEPEIVCARCGKNQNTAFVNTGSLKLIK